MTLLFGFCGGGADVPLAAATRVIETASGIFCSAGAAYSSRIVDMMLLPRYYLVHLVPRDHRQRVLLAADNDDKMSDHWCIRRPLLQIS